MTPTYLTGYVQAILDSKALFDHIDTAKQIDVNVTQEGILYNLVWTYVGEIRMTPYSVHDIHDRVDITIRDPEPVLHTDQFYWLPKDGIKKLWKECELMIERINEIEL